MNARLLNLEPDVIIIVLPQVERVESTNITFSIFWRYFRLAKVICINLYSVIRNSLLLNTLCMLHLLNLYVIIFRAPLPQFNIVSRSLKFMKCVKFGCDIFIYLNFVLVFSFILDLYL